MKELLVAPALASTYSDVDRLLGHVLPGFLSITIGTWWSYNIFYRYFVAQKEAAITGRGRKHSKFKSSLLFCCDMCWDGTPVEAFLLASALFVGIIGEIVTSFENGVFVRIENAHHISMYMFFGLMAFMNILTHYRPAVPADSDYAVGLLAFVNEGLLFSNHLHGRSPLNNTVHTLLLYLIAGIVICTALEIKYRREVTVAIGRAYFMIAQGTWLCHVGLILYPLPGMYKWDQESHPHMMVITLFFSLHLALNLIFLMLLAYFTNFRVRSMKFANIQRVLNDMNTEKSVTVIRYPNDNDEVCRAIISRSEDEE